MIKNKSLDLLTPLRALGAADRFIVETLPTLATGFCTSQNLVQNVETELNLDGPFVSKFQSRPGGVLTTNAKSGTLALPSDLWFTMGAATAVLTGKIRGVDNFGRDVYVEFTKATNQAIWTLAQSGQVAIVVDGLRGAGGEQLVAPRGCLQAIGASVGPAYICFSAIHSIKITNTSADTTVTVGPLNNATTSNRMPRIPIPVPITDFAELCDAPVLLDTGGATVTTPAAIPNRVAVSSTLIGRGDCLVALIAGSGGMVETVAGTNPYRWAVSYRTQRNRDK